MVSPAASETPPLGAGQLITAVVASLRTHIRELWPVWIGSAAAAAVAQYLAETFKLDAEGAGLTLGAVGLMAGLAALDAMYGGIATRIMLGRGRGAWRGDGRLAAYVGFTALAQLLPVLLMLGLVGDRALTQEALVADPALASRMMIGSLVALVSAWALFRLVVFQVSLAMGPAIPARTAWGQTRRALWAAIVAFSALGLAPMLVGVAGAALYREQGDLFALAAGSMGTGFQGLIGAALGAEIYRARAVHPEPPAPEPKPGEPWS